MEREFQNTRVRQSSHGTLRGDGSTDNEHLIRKPYALYRHGAQSLALPDRQSGSFVQRDLSSQMDGMYTVLVPQPFETSNEDLHLKRHVNRKSLLPWTRVYRMKTSTYKPDISGWFSSSSGDSASSEFLYSAVASQRYMVRMGEKAPPFL